MMNCKSILIRNVKFLIFKLQFYRNDTIYRLGDNDGTETEKTPQNVAKLYSETANVDQLPSAYYIDIAPRCVSREDRLMIRQ